MNMIFEYHTNADKEGLVCLLELLICFIFLIQRLIVWLTCGCCWPLQTGKDITRSVTPSPTPHRSDSSHLLGEGSLLLTWCVQLSRLLAVCTNELIAWLYFPYHSLTRHTFARHRIIKCSCPVQTIDFCLGCSLGKWSGPKEWEVL